MLEKLNWFCLASLIAGGGIVVKMNGSVLEEKSSLKLLELLCSFKLDWGSYIISIAETASKKIGSLIRSMKFFSLRFLCISINLPYGQCLENCCYIWTSAPSCYLELLDGVQKQRCRTVESSLAASLELLAHCGNVSSLSIYYRYYFGRCSSEVVWLVRIPYSQGRSTCYCYRLLDFRSPFLDPTRVSVSTVSFHVQLGSEIICL